MTPEERARFFELCRKLQTEQDPEKFDRYLREVNDLLDAKERRFKQDCEKDPLLRPPLPK